jgi:predicted DNA-binding protein (UPF0251 family)
MTKESITLSYQELNRLSLLEPIIAKRISQSQAAKQLQLSTRQVKRLVRAYRLLGAAGLQSKNIAVSAPTMPSALSFASKSPRK